MRRDLPPPDPHESVSDQVVHGPLPAPTAVFPLGPPSAEAGSVAELVLDLRPGLLVVLTRA
jgi:hypothetical protein